MWLIGGVIILALLRIGFMSRKWIRTWFEDDSDVIGSGFTLGELRQLHKSGQLSDAEFDSAKAVLLQGITAGKK